MTEAVRTHEDVRRILADQISAGRLRPGQRLGAERALAADLGVSRAALRQALAVLEEGGLVRRVPGRGGTFVSKGQDRAGPVPGGRPARPATQPGRGSRDQGAVRAAGPGRRGRGRALRLHPGDLVIDLVRIRLADGSPFSVEHLMLPADRFPGLLENLRRALRTLGGPLPQVLLAGGPAGDDELLGVLLRSLPGDVPVGRASVGGTLDGPPADHRYAAAVGLGLSALAE